MHNEINDLIAQISELKGMIKELQDDHNDNVSYRSRDINELATALAKAQGEYPTFKSNRENPFYKSRYADLGYIFSIALPILSKHGLSISQEEWETKDASVIIRTVLTHSSGQWTCSRSRFTPQKTDPQTFGSALNYRKRYAVCSLLGIAISSDPVDDDAEEVMHEARAVPYKAPVRQIMPSELVIKEQVEQLEHELNGYPDILKDILNGYSINSLAELPKIKYQASIDRIREIKSARNSIKK